MDDFSRTEADFLARLDGIAGTGRMFLIHLETKLNTHGCCSVEDAALATLICEYAKMGLVDLDERLSDELTIRNRWREVKQIEDGMIHPMNSTRIIDRDALDRFFITRCKLKASTYSTPLIAAMNALMDDTEITTPKASTYSTLLMDVLNLDNTETTTPNASTYSTPLMDAMNAAVSHFWEGIDPLSRDAPTNESVVEWLLDNYQEHNMSKNIAQAIATIIRNEGKPKNNSRPMG
jgi:hypothetical protein